MDSTMTISDSLAVSVVVTSYNRPNFLRECLNAILNQTFAAFEVIVVDDFSNFDPFALAASLNDSRIKVFQNKTGGAVAVNRNFGIRKAKGRYIAFCDDDDVWMKSKLKNQVAILDERPELMAVATNIATFPNGHSNHYLLNKNLLIDYDALLKAPFTVSRQTKIANSSVLIRKAIIEDLGGLDENVEVAAAEDYDLWLRVLQRRNRSILVLSQSLVKYRVHNENITRFISNQDRTYLKLKGVYKKHEQGYQFIERISFAQSAHIIKKEFFLGERSWLDVLKAPEIKLKDRFLILIKKWVRR